MTIEKGRIFFLGAGFSAGAGIPLTNTLLPKAAKLFAEEAEGLYQRVCWYADESDVDLNGSPDAEGFARLCTYLEFIELREHAGGERWSDDGSREKVALKFFLAKAIALSTPPPAEMPDCYLEFARSLTPQDVVVTFNWDLVLETAIEHVGGSYSYYFDWDKISIVKLHGSINWINNEPNKMREDRPSFGYLPLGFRDGLMKNEVYSSDILKKRRPWTVARALIDEVKPLLVLPGYGKAYDVRQLAILWYKIEALNIRNGGVSIIGLNVSHDDFIVESLFRYLFRHTFSEDAQVSVLNPDEKVGARFREFAGGLPIKFHCDRLNSATLPTVLLRA